MTDPAHPARPSAAMAAVWDPLVRLGHWTLLAAVAVALVTRGEPEGLHQAAGYAVAGYVVWRLFWGFAGPRRARFGDFVRSPLAGLRYLADLVSGRAERRLGHSPAGGLMVLALLAALAGTAATGMAMESRQPVPAVFAALVPAEAGEEDDEDGVWAEAHEMLANAVLGLALLHVAGVALASLAHRENLVRAMIDGRKREPGRSEPL